MSTILCPCIFCVALLMELFVLFVACLTVFVNCLMKQFAMCLCVVAVLLLNVMDVFIVWVVALYRIWYSTECVCCACDLSVPSICLFVFSYVGSYFLI